MKKSIFTAALGAAMVFSVAATAAAEDTILAKVEGHEITRQDLELAIDSLPQEVRQQVRGNPEFKAQLLEELVRQEMVFAEAKRRNFDENEAVRNRLRLLERELMVTAFLEDYLSRNMELSEEDKQRFYEDNKERFVTQETVSASHILIEDREEAQQVLQQALDGADFGQLARDHSVDTGSARQEGYIGEFYRGQGLVQEFEDAAFAADEGIHPELVRTQFGYHIINVHEKSPSRSVSFDEARERITEILTEEQQQQVLRRLLQELELRYDSEVYPERLD
ncbi:peptidylprolyl isomerase [Desulfurispira natronophila]|uniref:Peptidyl-prolyl cis-trans isomerase C n=1 Tax=Desulfurispira natronophila TaxID=682562 RepID=A0A7W8DH38_9BACT|nr:peptidylprolyl isomerase [Desulfurispira natronophila]MBB5021873.1 peptidyl-prolyl cis-trans isomerase C [Desulfurispira natronophila]